MILPAQERQARLAIHRLGQDCVLAEPTGGSENAYGKIDGETFGAVATEKVVRSYEGRGSPAVGDRQEGGRLPAESPILFFRADSAVQTGFRVTYAGQTYEINSLTHYPTHSEATTTLVQ